MNSTSWGKSARWYKKIVGQKGHYFHQHVILPALLRMMKLKSTDTLLDVGCGQGILARSIPPDIMYTGVDISGALINEAKRMDTNGHHVYINSDASLPLRLPKASFDKVVMILSLQNIKNWGGVVANIDNLLKPRGSVFLVLNHPYFRIPRQTGWMIDEGSKLQKRWINSYMSSLDIPIKTHPSDRRSLVTWSFHRPLSELITLFKKHNFVLRDMEELVSDKESEGARKKK